MANTAVDPNVAPEVVFTAKDLEAAGLGTLTELQAKLKQAGIDQEERQTIDNRMSEIVDMQKTLTGAMQALTVAKTAEIEEERYEEAMNSGFVSHFKSLAKDDPKREEIKGLVAAEFGHKAASLALEGSALRKAIERPVSKKNSQYEESLEIKDAFDLAYIWTAAQQKIFDNGEKKAAEIDFRTFRKALEGLNKENVGGAEHLIKTLDTSMDTLTSGEGAEWLPIGMSSNMVDDVHLELKVAALFPRYYMPTKTYDVPVRLERTFGYRMPEGTSPSQYFTNLARPANMKTGKVRFEAEKLATLQMLSDELDQDSVVPVLRLMREDAVWGIAASTEDAIINGCENLALLDNAGADGSRLWNNTTDQGDGIRINSGVSDVRAAWNGLRYLANTGQKVDFQNASLSLLKLRSLRRPMGKYATRIADLAYIISAGSHIDFLNLDEVVTLEKYGPNATVLQGEIGKLDGIPIIVSDYMYNNLNASGVFNTTTPGISPSNRTTIILVHRKGFAFGDRQIIRVEAERQPLSGIQYVLATNRVDFKKVFPTAEPLVSVGYNHPA